MIQYPIIRRTSDVPSLRFSFSTAGRRKKTGASELVAFSRIFRLGLEHINEDVCVIIDGYRYEPDLAYIDKEKGVYVDIEIDEPYSGNHHPTHYITANGQHKDSKRNDAFSNAGWHVVRFTEQQMFCDPKACMRVVYDLLLSIGAIDTMPSCLCDASLPQEVPALKYEEAKHRSHQRYRKSYLGYEPVDMDIASYLRCCLLVIPILFQSITNARVRKMLFKQLKGFFIK